MRRRILNYILKPFYYIRDGAFSNTIILIYSMGKVGSTSIYFSLKKKLPVTDIFHVHFLSDYWLNEKLPRMNKYFHGNINHGKEILSHIRKNPGKRIKIITLVREPISRDVSDFFQNWKSEYKNIEGIKTEQILQAIEENKHEYTLNWFDTEFKNYLGFDVYKIPFDTEKGYKIYNLPNIDILCLKLEEINKTGHKALNEFLGIQLSLLNKNTSLEKKGKELYLEVKKKYKASKSKLHELYSSNYVRHFYTEEEINTFKEKWG